MQHARRQAFYVVLPHDLHWLTSLNSQGQLRLLGEAGRTAEVQGVPGVLLLRSAAQQAPACEGHILGGGLPPDGADSR